MSTNSEMPQRFIPLVKRVLKLTAEKWALQAEVVRLRSEVVRNQEAFEVLRKIHTAIKEDGEAKERLIHFISRGIP